MLVQLASEILGQVGHLLELGDASLVDPFPHLCGPIGGQTAVGEPSFELLGRFVQYV